MNDFINEQWNKFCDRLRACANSCGQGNRDKSSEFERQANEFIQNHQPDSYPRLLELIGEGTLMTVNWKSRGIGPLPTEQSGSGEMAYQESENHAPIPYPEESIAEQAEIASDDLPSKSSSVAPVGVGNRKNIDAD